MLIIVFGEMGMGKTFVGKLIAERFQYHFYDGDDALKKDQKLLNRDDVDKFIDNQLIPSIEIELKKNTNLVMSQALYFEKHRKKIQEYFRDLTSVRFIHVLATDELQNQRLLKRSEAEGFWLPYAARSKRRFEGPPPGNPLYSQIINNTNEEDIITQVNKLSYLPKFYKEYKTHTLLGASKALSAEKVSTSTISPLKYD